MKRLMIMILICCLALAGCGNESKAELTDIEQFRCQDSIQTVFDVLGKTQIESGIFEGEYYIYEDLNLFGYNGEAVFSVRNDKDTIARFYCYLTLNDKEFEELLSRFSDKYGSYEVKKHEYENSEIATYEWKTDEEKSKELGYSDICIQYNGNKKYTIYFSDEWSIKDDEAYYEYLKELEEDIEKEELESEKSSNDINILFHKEYEVDGEKINIAANEDNGEMGVSIIGNAKDEEKASIMFACYKMYLDEIGGLNKYDIAIIVKKASIMYFKDGEETTIMGVNRDGSLAFSSPDWIVTDFSMSEEEIDSFAEEITNTIKDFGESAEINN